MRTEIGAGRKERDAEELRRRWEATEPESPESAPEAQRPREKAERETGRRLERQTESDRA